jgi:hypothetical protein
MIRAARILSFVLIPPMAACAAIVAVAAEFDRPPVVLRKLDPTPPVEAWGSGIAPAVTVRLKLDARGKVASVEIPRIEPSSPLDAAFERTGRENHAEWRFAPAIKDGKPSEATLEWAIEFSKFGARPSTALRTGRMAPDMRAGGLTLDPRAAESSQVDEWYLFVSGLSWTERLEVLARTRRTAESYLGPANRVSASSPHFEVVTNAVTADVAARIAGNLEASYGATYELFESKIPTLKVSDRVVAVVFGLRATFKAFLSTSHGSGFAEGIFAPEGLLAFHMEMGANELLTQLMIHESAHAFLERHVVAPGVRFPLWLNEGLAEYIAKSDVEKGRIVPGSHKKRRTVYHNPVADRSDLSTSALGATEIRKAFHTGKAIPLDQLFTATRDTFYGERHELFYGEAWLFVHFLRHGKPTWANEEFPRFVLYVAEGFAPEDVFTAVYGRAPTDLGEDFRKYVEAF